ncbi:MAG: FkbM family methyltransferase [Rhizobiaceae bacterium]|nr:FkbM family methyltransferase [Rhizobiaceae bacterium]MCV0408604.1 FkbM family methyltransferase [Rhizobiaceae bacterium]
MPAVTLADLLERIGDPPSFTLIADIEGAELALFEREAEALSRCGLAIVEIHPKLFTAAGRDERGFLTLAAEAGLVPVDRSADVLALARRDHSSGRSGVSSSR